MKCEECQILIEDYLDGALDQKAVERLTLHVADCAQCTKFHEELSREQEIYACYQRDVEVTPVMWSSIEARIKQERAAQPTGVASRIRERLAGYFAAPRLSPAFAAALVLIAIGITVGVMTYLNSGHRETRVANNNASAPNLESKDNSPQAPNVQREPEVMATNKGSGEVPSVRKEGRTAPQKHLLSGAQPTPVQLVREAEQKYLTAIAMLSRDVNRQRSQLDPIMLARFDASLADIDRTIKETRRVVRENPGDPIALQYLLAAYSKKVDVLREMTNE